MSPIRVVPVKTTMAQIYEEERQMADYESHPIHGVLADMAALVESKANDYADSENVYSNFEGAARLTNKTVDEVFHIITGIKMERLRQLMAGKTPNHESLEDTLMDAANYFALWLGYRRQEEDRLASMVVGSIISSQSERLVTNEYELQLDRIDAEV